MRRSSSGLGSPAGLPPELEQLLLDVVADGFVIYCCGHRSAPTALVAFCAWCRYVDLITIRDFDQITAVRVPKQGPVDVFAPEAVVWTYEKPAEHTLWAAQPGASTAPGRPHRCLPGAVLPAGAPA